jgi:hypothetical protein
LARSGEILRVARGVYVRPRVSKLLGAVRPGPFEVAQAVAEAEGARLAVHGAVWALKLGLTTHVMSSPTYLTDGSTRRIRLGKSVITLRHASPREMRLSATSAGRALLALEWLGEPENPGGTLETIRRGLAETEYSEFIEEVRRTRGWIAKALKGAKSRNPAAV